MSTGYVETGAVLMKAICTFRVILRNKADFRGTYLSYIPLNIYSSIPVENFNYIHFTQYSALNFRHGEKTALPINQHKPIRINCMNKSRTSSRIGILNKHLKLNNTIEYWRIGK